MTAEPRLSILELLLLLPLLLLLLLSRGGLRRSSEMPVTVD